MRRPSKTFDRLSQVELAEVAAARAAARARFAHFADLDGESEDTDVVDPDNPPMADDRLTQLRPAAEVAPGLVSSSLRRRGGQPRSPVPKVAVSLGLDPDVLGVLRASGDGWQNRVNTLLRRTLGLDLPEPPTADNVARIDRAIAESRVALAEAEQAEKAARRALERAIAGIEAADLMGRSAFDETPGDSARAISGRRPQVD